MSRLITSLITFSVIATLLRGRIAIILIRFDAHLQGKLSGASVADIGTLVLSSAQFIYASLAMLFAVFMFNKALKIANTFNWLLV